MGTGADTAYGAFLASKRVEVRPVGFAVADSDLHPALFDWQRAVARWAIRRGRAALFCECGLGKTLMQLEWARHVHDHTRRDVLILAPLAVASQTADEGTKFDIAVTLCRSQADVRPGINVANYEMLGHFNPEHFAGVVLDESSILKAYMGKTKRALVEAFAATPYKLCCTATPAPNDHMELGNHAEFLGVMRSGEMLMRWFVNDTMAAGKYRLKGHAERDYWDWVASWAVAMRRPSDIGYPDDGYALPPLEMRTEVVEVDRTIGRSEGRLFRDPTMSATTLHREMRLTAPARAERVAALVNGSTDAWAVWCNTDYEADALMACIPDAVEVRGSHPLATKEERLRAFTRGEVRVLVTKPGIAGYGLNWQHCHRTAFTGLSYSFEDLYQALRRLYRFGQAHAVEAALVVAETEGPILETVRRKMAEHERMVGAMAASTARLALREDLHLAAYDPRTPMALPEWLRSDAA